MYTAVRVDSYLVQAAMTTSRIGQSVLHLATANAGVVPLWMAEWWPVFSGGRIEMDDPGGVLSTTLKERPRLIVIDARPPELENQAHEEHEWTTSALSACKQLKRDPFTGIVPVLVLVPSLPAGVFVDAFAAGADEVLREDVNAEEGRARLSGMLRRSDRDTDVHPSTRLPGSREIRAELARRVATNEKFAACYADLDHFKEFNDRYGYHRGDSVIQLLARILHDVVKGLCPIDGFVGHIGGDDFLFTVPLVALQRVCDEIVQVFDELIPWQYTDQDRRAGYFFGKDRRGQLHRVPLMTLSVGVVTNHRRHFTRADEVSELATEMKSYAKTLPGSLWAVDRRRNEVASDVADGAREYARVAMGHSRLTGDAS